MRANYKVELTSGVFLLLGIAAMLWLATEATEAYEEVRVKVCNFLNGDDPKSIVFTRNTTESINLVAHAWGRKNIGPGDEIVLTVMEHHSNLVPWQMLAEHTQQLTPEQTQAILSDNVAALYKVDLEALASLAA